LTDDIKRISTAFRHQSVLALSFFSDVRIKFAKVSVTDNIDLILIFGFNIFKVTDQNLLLSFFSFQRFKYKLIPVVRVPCPRHYSDTFVFSFLREDYTKRIQVTKK